MGKIFLYSCFIILLAVPALEAQAADAPQASDTALQGAAPVSADSDAAAQQEAGASDPQAYGIIGLNAVDAVKTAALDSEKALLEVIEDKKLESSDTISVIPQSVDEGADAGVAGPNAAALVDAAGGLTVNVFDAISGEYINDASVSITAKGLGRQTLNTSGATTFPKLRPGTYQIDITLGSNHPMASYFKPPKRMAIDIPPSAQLTSNIYLMPKKVPALALDVKLSDVSYRGASISVSSTYRILRYRVAIRDVSTGTIYRERDIGIAASPFELKFDDLEDGKRYAAEVKADFLSEVASGSVASSVSKTIGFTTARLPDFVIGKFEASPTLCSKEREDTIIATARLRLYHNIGSLRVKIVSGPDLLYSRTFTNLSKGVLNIRVPISSRLFSSAGTREMRITADAAPNEAREKKEVTVSIVDNELLSVDIKPQPARPRSIDELTGIAIGPLTPEKDLFARSISQPTATLSTSASEMATSFALNADATTGDMVISAAMLQDFARQVSASMKSSPYIPDLKVAVRGKSFYDEGEIILGERVFQFSVFEDTVKSAEAKITAAEPLIETEPFEFTVAVNSPARFTKLKLNIADGADDSVVDIAPVPNKQTGNFELSEKFRRTYTFDDAKRQALIRLKAVTIRAQVYYIEFDRWSDEYVSATIPFIRREDFETVRQTVPRVDLVVLQDIYTLEKAPVRAKLSCSLNFSKIRFEFGDGSEPEMLDVAVQAVDGEKAVEIGHVYKKEGNYPLKVSVLCSDYGIWSGSNEFYTIKVLPLRGSNK